MSGQTSARIGAVIGILAGLVAIGDGLYAHFQSPQPAFGIPGFLLVYSPYLSGVHMLVGLGVIVVVGGLLAFKWPALGIGIVCAGAMIGLISVYDRGAPPFKGDAYRLRWMPYFYYWAAPWVLAWVSGIFGGLSLQKSIKPYDSPAPIDRPGVAPAPE